jgi:hypothetical protein
MALCASSASPITSPMNRSWRTEPSPSLPLVVPLRPLNPRDTPDRDDHQAAWQTLVLYYGRVGIMMPSELGSGPAKAASGWAARVTSPRMLILAAAALALTNIPLTPYRSGGQPDYFWPSLSVLLAVWQLWNHRRLAWAALTAATAAALLFCGLSIARVINAGLPGWWIPITGAADFLALAILLSPPIRRWVAKKPAPVP